MPGPDDSRALGARIAANYDRVVYDPDVGERLDPARLLAIAARHVAVGEPVGVLDLGCGRGAQLARCASIASGPLVGVDLSASACAAATARLEPFGDRATIRCVDFLDLAPDQLGQFAIVYHVGVHYLLPAAVQRHVLAILGASVRPGGVAVISYYAGTVSILRAAIHRSVRATIDPALAPDAAVAQARARMEEIRAELSEARHAALIDALVETCAKNDTVFFHEVCNHAFDAIHTSALEATLAGHGLGFVGYLDASPAEAPSTSQARAFAADLFDFQRGGYRHAVFARPSA